MIRNKTSIATSFAPLLEKYFLSYMISQKRSSPQTISSYRDSFSIYLGFLSKEHKIPADKIELEHFSLEYLSSFEKYLENCRKCSSTTINLRMASIRSFLKYASVEAPEYSGLIRKALSIPSRKTDKPVMTFLTKHECESMLEACNSQSLLSSRDKMMLMILYNTGCRVSELTNIRVPDISLARDATSFIRFFGKGRKERTTPIWKSTGAYIEKHIKVHSLNDKALLLQNNRGGVLTRSGVSQRIAVISEKASATCPSLKEKTITPHTFRHSVAMNLMQSGVDISTIAIWLGHESIETTHKYMIADMEIKRKAMEKLDETTNGSYTYKPSRSILAFLKSL